MTINEEQFAELIDQERDRLLHLCRVYTDRREDEKDLFQEIIIQVWHSLPSFNEDAKLSTWIYRIAVNTAISFVRKKNTRQQYYSNYKSERQTKETWYSAPDVKDEDPQTRQLYEAISQLNVSEKAVVTMYLDDFSYKEIAFVTDMTTNHVGVKLSRIKDKLSKIIGV